ncbi:MAG: acyl-CoA dehydrogenase family protein [Pseudomonadota bacterium]
MSENSAFFRETVERILAETLTNALIEACERREMPRALIAALVDNGVTMMLVPESAGGIGASIADAVAVLRTLGAAAAPGPILETILGNALLAEAGLDPVDGTLALAFCSDDPPVLHDIPWGGLADHVLVVSDTGISISKAAEWAVRPSLDAAGEPRDTLSDGPEGSFAPLDVHRATRTAAVLRAGQILGAIEWSLSRSIEYAGERKQFGREISKFQVIQQMLAELAAHLLASAVLTEAAAEALTETMISAARSRLGDAADAAISISHQVHGAMGFSREYALNHRTRRLMSWRDDFGSVLEWRRALAGGFVDCSRETFWPTVSDAGLAIAS